MTLDIFEAMLQQHDWYYQYAEGKDYYDGKASEDAIMQAIRELGKQGLSAESKALWLKHKPTTS